MADRLIGNYRVIRLVGEGGMGLVYEAVRDDIGARAAIKVLRPEFARNADVAGRFINEARAVNMVQHPGLVRVFDYGQLPTGEAYLAMEFLDGESLRQRLHRHLRISEADTMRLARQIASAVASAHAKQIVHRDLKPENVMIIADVEAPGGERAKVLDFGIAKLEPGTRGAVHTRTNTMMGTPVYMAPEQCRGLKTISDRADVYSLSVMMFEMLTSRPPFQSEAPGDLIAMHMLQPPPSLRDFLPDVDPMLQRMIEAMLSKDPQARPAMADVAQQLKALGHLQSDVMPMRVLRDSGGEARPGPVSFGLPQRSFNMAAPEPAVPAQLTLAARPRQPPDLDATVQLRDGKGLPLPARPGKALVKPRGSVDRMAHLSISPRTPPEGQGPPGPVAEPTTALPAEALRDFTPKPTKEQQKRLELLVLLGLLAVIVLVGILVLLNWATGEAGR